MLRDLYNEGSLVRDDELFCLVAERLELLFCALQNDSLVEITDERLRRAIFWYIEDVCNDLDFLHEKFFGQIDKCVSNHA